MMSEAQRAERVRTILRAQIIFNNSMTTIEAVIRNLSATGARISLEEHLPVAQEFDLHIPQKNVTHRARVVWRDKGLMGVHFIPAAVSEVAVQQDLSGPGAALRIRALEMQNAELKERLKILTKRLTDLGQDVSFAA